MASRVPDDEYLPPHPLPGNLSPDTIDVPSELANILSRIHYQPASANASNAQPPLSTKDLPGAIDPLKRKLQQARAAVHTLPDISRTIPEQEAEMRAIEERIENQRAALRQLKEYGLQFAVESAGASAGGAGGDVEMGGTTGVSARSSG